MDHGSFRVKAAFSAVSGGILRVFQVGELVPSGSPVLKGRANFFEPVSDYVTRPVVTSETASATPDEKRTRGRPRKVIV